MLPVFIIALALSRFLAMALCHNRIGHFFIFQNLFWIVVILTEWKLKMRMLESDILNKLVTCEDVETKSVLELEDFLKNEPGISNFAPDDFYAQDPRDGSTVVYNSKRATRPHDNKNSEDKPAQVLKPCPICEGNTTGIIDVAPLSAGSTFINKNLFPCFYIKETNQISPVTPENIEIPDKTGVSMGHHYLQWTSSIHDNDWHNMLAEDLAVVLQRTGALEKTLLLKNDSNMPDTSKWHHDKKTKGFVSIIKNYGAEVGGSLTHGHQQITLSNIMSKSSYDNFSFYNNFHLSFSTYMSVHTPKSLIVADYETGYVAVPYFMKRPLGAMYFVKNSKRTLFSDLTDAERLDMAKGINYVTKAYHALMPSLGKSVAYNILFHSGPGADVYIEFLPFTQETGGMEQLHLFVCQSTPNASSELLRSVK